VAVVPVLVDTPMILSSVLALWVGGCLTVVAARSLGAVLHADAGGLYRRSLPFLPSTSPMQCSIPPSPALPRSPWASLPPRSPSLFLPQSVAVPLGARLERWLADAEAWLADCVRDPAEGGARAAPARTAATGRRRGRLRADGDPCL
jgi:hypothetical protein